MSEVRTSFGGTCVRCGKKVTGIHTCRDRLGEARAEIKRLQGCEEQSVIRGNRVIEVERRLADAQREIERLRALLERAGEHVEKQDAEIERLRASFKFITDWHEAKWRNRLNPQHARYAHKESWERCLSKAREVRGE